ncbi:ANTAR domain-containing protein [Streptomyces sp. NPDC026672]|uniref:ANTAR domain-containing protein n=1 Tax=unclassified Streptomyces TaxID=2593676 RepID=UPI0033FC7BB6
MHHTERETRLAAALVEAADTLTEGFDTGRHLQRLADHCVELLSARAAGVMLVGGGRTVTPAGSSRREAVALDLLAAQRHGGPCADSCGSGRPVPPVSVRAAHETARWPEFTARALAHGVAVTYAVPLRRHETLLGALNVFAPDDDDHDDGDGDHSDSHRGDGGHGGAGGAVWAVWAGETELRLAQVLADAAALGLHNQRAFDQHRALAGQLQQALSSRVRIEQAKGMLAERWGVGADEAFGVLRRYARRHRTPVDLVARAVLERTLDDTELRGGAGGPAN